MDRTLGLMEMMAFGCLRYTHITRSEPRRLTQGFCIVAAPNGKKKHHRDGFDYAIPASLSIGFFWGKKSLKRSARWHPVGSAHVDYAFVSRGDPGQLARSKKLRRQNQTQMF